MFSKPKNPHSTQKYRPEYSYEWPFISRSNREGYVHCKICRTEFSITHSGKYDIGRHISSGKHEDNKKLIDQGESMSKALENFVKLTPSSEMFWEGPEFLYCVNLYVG